MHFSHLDPENKGSTLIHDPRCVQQAAPRPPPQQISGGGESLQSLTQDIFSLSQRLASRQGEESAPNWAVIEAFQSAKYSLTTVIASMEGKGVLPEKDVIAPNQKSWPETAKCMGAKKDPRCRCLSDEIGLTEYSLGAIKGKQKCLHNDYPYAGGERSGKRAKSDALSQAANARAHVPPNASPVPSPSPNAPSPATCSPYVPPPFASFSTLPTFANRPH